ncbi:MAG: hypothetical protein J5J00_13960 [Deltaproteobacteria bacterium]|nr:hypothetical protein [Deltaproteobacteria bacterium]
MTSQESPGIKWLSANNSSIKWRLLGPNIANPFDSQAADSRLEEFVADRSALMEVCSIQALMDETAIVKISDLISFRFETEHPNLMDLSPEELKRFLETSGVWENISKEFKALQESCRAELARRRGE